MTLTRHEQQRDAAIQKSLRGIEAALERQADALELLALMFYEGIPVIEGTDEEWGDAVQAAVVKLAERHRPAVDNSASDS